MFQKSFPVIIPVLLIALIISLFFYPAISIWLSLTLLLFTLGLTLFFTIQKHQGTYQQGQITRLKFVRNVLLDLLGLLLAIAAASFAGGISGARLGKSFGFGVGLIAGIALAFLGAWSVRKLWGRLMTIM